MLRDEGIRDQIPVPSLMPLPLSVPKPEPTDRILLVDDQSFNVDALEIILTHNVNIPAKDVCDRALSGKQAIQHVKDNVAKNGGSRCDYKLVLMDCNMPFMSGYEATGLIRQFLYECGAEQPIVVAVTGHSEQSYVDMAITSGMNQVFSKPVKGDLLKDVLR